MKAPTFELTHSQMGRYRKLEAENAKLRKVVDAAKDYTQYLPTSEPIGAARYSGQVVSSYNLKCAIAALDDVVG